MVCVGVPIGSPQIVQAFECLEKIKTMVENAKLLRILTDPTIPFKLVRFCPNTKISTAPSHQRQWRIRPAAFKRRTMLLSTKCYARAPPTAAEGGHELAPHDSANCITGVGLA
jgi:hypothetical protein